MVSVRSCSPAALLVLFAGAALAQSPPYRDPNPNYPAAQRPLQQPYGPQPAAPQTVPANGYPQGPPPAQAVYPQQPGAPYAQPAPVQPLHRPPFELTPQEQAQVEEVLTTWEEKSSKIKTYSCSGFERWEYDPVFGPGQGKIAKSKSIGQLKYIKPDRGLFKIHKVTVWDEKAKDWLPDEKAFGEHWLCDGKSVSEFDAAQKVVRIQPLPPELQGKAIADGPLPFLFGAEKTKILARYFIRVTNIVDNQIWLKAYPKLQRDAANFEYVEVILTRDEYLPTHIMVYLPGGGNLSDQQRARTLYIFPDAKVNHPLERFMGVFDSRIPLGWQTVNLDEQPAAPAPAPQQPLNQAQRPTLRYPQ